MRLLAAMVDAGGDARHAARMPRCFPATLRPDMTTPTIGIPSACSRNYAQPPLRAPPTRCHQAHLSQLDNRQPDRRHPAIEPLLPRRTILAKRATMQSHAPLHHCVPQRPAPASLCSLTLVQRGRRSIRCMRCHPRCDGAHLWTIRHAWMAPKRRVLLPRPARWFAQPSAPRCHKRALCGTALRCARVVSYGQWIASL